MDRYSLSEGVAKLARNTKFGIRKVYTDPQALIADPEVQMVDVCTPTDTHLELSLAVIEAGKHVLCEKPIARSAADAYRLHQAVTGKGLRSKTGFTFRYSPALRQIRAWIEDGTIGEIFHIHGLEQNSQFLDPDFPLVVGVLEGVQATAENEVEAALVARVVAALRGRFADEDDDTFWRKRLFIVGPHHVQIRAIRRALDAVRDWDARPFIGTVDKMQGQECDAVIVSYGVSDVEYALGERDFIYSLNRLNVAITRARAKSIVFLPRPLLEPPIQALNSDRAADGIAYMQGLANWCEQRNPPLSIGLPKGRLAVLMG